MIYYDEDECFYVVGRFKEIFKYRGWHILPNIIEDIIMSHPAVKEAAVIGIPHEIDGDHVMAVVVLFEGYDKSYAKEIEELVNKKVGDSQQLRAGVEIVDSLPKTTTHKIRRHFLQKMMIDTIKNRI
jgi:4-coumarate--CoA ligase